MVRVVSGTLRKISSGPIVVNQSALFEVFIEYEAHDIKCGSNEETLEKIAVFISESGNIEMTTPHTQIDSIGVCDNFGTGPGCGGFNCVPYVGCMTFCFPIQFATTFYTAMSNGYLIVMEYKCPSDTRCFNDNSKRAILPIAVAPEQKENTCYLTVSVKNTGEYFANVYINGSYAGKNSVIYEAQWGELVEIEISGTNIKTEKIEYLIPYQYYDEVVIQATQCDIFCKMGEYAPIIIVGSVVVLGGYLAYRYYSKSKMRSSLIRASRKEEERRQRKEEAEEARMKRLEELILLSGARR